MEENGFFELGNENVCLIEKMFRREICNRNIRRFHKLIHSIDLRIYFDLTFNKKTR